jgi:hypothetical protein
MMRKRYFVKQSLSKELNAGPKAKLDTYKTLERLGYEPILYESGAERRLPRYFQGLKIVFKLIRLKDSIVLMENPIKNWRFLTLANRIMRSRKNRLILLIHDIESERYVFPKHIEYSYIGSFNSIIAHNEAMKAFLASQIDEEIKIYTLNIFDYLLDPGFKIETKPNCRVDLKKKQWEIIFCGNLGREKSPFIYALNGIDSPNWNLNLYGRGIEDTREMPLIKYGGSFDPGKPAVNENSDFGLIWDGSSIDTCDGITGAYMKLNNPHKLSLYIALNLPVIVWNEAAAAKIVEDNGLGFSVGSLSEISNKLFALTQDEYQRFCTNMERFNKRVTSGEYLASALKQIDGYLDQEIAVYTQAKLDLK